MGWKSTVYISRSEAIRLIADRFFKLEYMNNSELEDMVEAMGYGENTNLSYFGHNFTVMNDDDIKDN
jgi:hypothetical protein